MPYVLQRYVNHVLNEIPGYRGDIGTVNLKLWRGAYQIQDLRLQKTTGKVPVPFFEAKTVDLMIEWRELFHGAIVGQVTLYEPKLNYVEGPDEASSQTNIDNSWQASATELFPLRINRFRLVDGEIHFRNFHTQPKVDVFLKDVQAEARNLKNTQRLGDKLFAIIDVTGQPARGSSLTAHMRLNPFATKSTFDLKGELLGYPLVNLNNYLMTYSGFEVRGGHLDVYTEMTAVNGSMDGYIKPILKNTAVKVWSGQESNPTQYVLEPLKSFISLFMKNWPHNQFATKIPVSGDFDDPRIHSWIAFLNLIKNAWVKAAEPGLDQSTSHPTTRDMKEPSHSKTEQESNKIP